VSPNCPKRGRVCIQGICIELYMEFLRCCHFSLQNWIGGAVTSALNTWPQISKSSSAFENYPGCCYFDPHNLSSNPYSRHLHWVVYRIPTSKSFQRCCRFRHRELSTTYPVVLLLRASKPELKSPLQASALSCTWNSNQQVCPEVLSLQPSTIVDANLHVLISLRKRPKSVVRDL
jgi:hypothetical protein